MTTHVASSDGVAIAFDSTGNGTPAVVFVHGWSCDRSYWRHQLSLSDNFQLVTLDLAGHGDSDDGRAEWTMQAYGNDVVAVIEELNLADVVIVGHSMGGNAGLEAACRLGAVIRGLVWVDTYGTMDVPVGTPPVSEIVAPFEADFVATVRHFVQQMFQPNDDQDVARWVVDDMSAAPKEIATAAIRASLTYGRAAKTIVDKVAVPIVAINTGYLGANVESLRSSGVEVLRLPDSGHFPMLTDPEPLNAMLAETIGRFRR